MVFFVGAGPGAIDLITVRGQKKLSEADVVIYAGSLVNPELLSLCKENSIFYDSALMTLEDVISVIKNYEKQNKIIVRLHTGDPSLYGAVREQMDILDSLCIPYESVPGVSSFCAAAASLNLEYTLPNVSQSVIITRLEGRTPVPENEQFEKLALLHCTMIIFLSASMINSIQERLLKVGYAKDTSVAIVYKASWKDEKRLICKLENLFETAKQNGINKTALVIIGDVIEAKNYLRSKLYDPNFTTEFRKGMEN